MYNSLVQKYKLFSRREFFRLSGAGIGIFVIPYSYHDEPEAGINQKQKKNIYDFFEIGSDWLTVKSGTLSYASGNIEIKNEKLFRIKPVDIINVEDEKIVLSGYKAQGFFTGSKLAGPRAGNINAMHSFIKESLRVYDKPGENILVEGSDYIVSAPFALLALAEGSKIKPGTTVYVSYSYYLQRIDSIMVSQDGTPFLSEGMPAIVSPNMPDVPENAVRLCNIYHPFRKENLSEELLFPCLAHARDIVTETTTGRIPQTLEKLRKGKKVKIVCWGDSITVGADVEPNSAWAKAFETNLKKKYPDSPVTFFNHSIGGSKSAQWLHEGNYPGLPKLPSEKCSFKKIMDRKPDLIVMEFLNDTVLDQASLDSNYQMLNDNLKRIGSELIIVTPSKKINENFDISEMKKKDQRRYVSFAKSFANKNQYAIADTTSRWDHLYLEGIPYYSLFNNGYNHPNEFGHQLFVDEIMKCFS